MLDAAEEDVLAYMTFPKEHRAKLHSTNPIERLNGEIKRRTDVVGILDTIRWSDESLASSQADAGCRLRATGLGCTSAPGQ
jgi:transposase-like protein